MYNVLHSLRLRSGSKMSKNKFRLFYFLMVPLLLSAVALRAEENKTYSGKFIVEPPTLASLGFEWRIDGDDNRNAGVAVRYRKRGEDTWRDALPLLRLQREKMIDNYGAYDYVVPNMFAGSIMDLQADTEYEVKLRLTDPDGVENAAQQQFFIRTRAEPRPYNLAGVFSMYIPRDLRVKSRNLHLQGSWAPFIPAQTARTGLTPTRPG